MKPLGLGAQLTLFYTALFSLILGLFSLGFYHTLKQRLESASEADLREVASGLRGYLHFRNAKPALVFDQESPEEAYFIRTATRYFQVFDGSTGELLDQSRELELLGLSLSPVQVASLVANPRFTEVIASSERLRFHSFVVRNSRQHPFLVQVGDSLTPFDNTLLTYRRSLFLFVPAGVLLAVLGGWWMARRALRPIESLTTTAQQIDISQLDRRLPLRGTNDQLDRLAATFNQTFARLEDAVTQMRQFTASISHELRTPLTALRGEAEVTLLEASSVEDYRRVLASQLEEFDKLARMINQLLILARAEAGEITLEAAPVDLSALAHSVSEQLQPLAEWKSVDLRVSGSEVVEVTGDSVWLERVIVNLIDNAIKFTPSGGAVQVSISSRDGHACLEVRDNGSGISPEALPFVFDRFFRADPSRTRQIDGAGLGLSLVRWIVLAHGGSVAVSNLATGGSCFTVLLPKSSSPALPASALATAQKN